MRKFPRYFNAPVYMNCENSPHHMFCCHANHQNRFFNRFLVPEPPGDIQVLTILQELHKQP